MERDCGSLTSSHAPRIVLIGTGNVAWHLSAALDRVADVVAVYGRTASRANDIASRTRNARAVTELTDVPRDADFYVIAVTDSAIPAIAASLPEVNGIVAHTSGTTGAEALSACRARGTGSFYPLQTFSAGRAVSLSEVPFFIEGSDAATAASLHGLAEKVSGSVYALDSERRRRMHLAAVVASNFANALWGAAGDILALADLPLEVLQPLLTETIRKAFATSPRQAQTGPARRNDTATIGRHLDMIDDPLLKEIYTDMTQLIIKQQSKE